MSSCTAHIEELCDPKDRISDFGAEWRQFRLVVGAPDAEAKFEYWKKKAAEQSTNAGTYPTLFAFHGSPTQNWHSVRYETIIGAKGMFDAVWQIIRHGLWHKTIAHGRAHGNGA